MSRDAMNARMTALEAAARELAKEFERFAVLCSEVYEGELDCTPAAKRIVETWLRVRLAELSTDAGGPTLVINNIPISANSLARLLLGEP